MSNVGTDDDGSLRKTGAEAPARRATKGEALAPKGAAGIRKGDGPGRPRVPVAARWPEPFDR